jgi:hypothetical protein
VGNFFPQITLIYADKTKPPRPLRQIGLKKKNLNAELAPREDAKIAEQKPKSLRLSRLGENIFLAEPQGRKGENVG